MDSPLRAIAIVGLGAILPDAPNPTIFWNNILNKRYSITQVPSDRWCVSDYYDPDPAAPDKTYSQIGGWVRGFEFDWKRYKLPPKMVAAMDQGQQWAVAMAAQALADYGYPEKPLDTERTAVVLGTAMGGELHYLTHLRIAFPEFARALESVAEFGQLPPDIRQAIVTRWHAAIDQTIPPITEDSMPGELPNIVSGRVANVLSLRGPNFITDAACASALAAVGAAVELLTNHEVDAVITGGVDRNMGVSTFVKFCKIGALSATGTRPFGDGADGFVMGEGAAAFLLKRLEDAERTGDKIYAVIRGVGGASDGKGKGITAPNPLGQQLAMKRAWKNAGLDPATATLIEAHGTSTKVGDVVEVESLNTIFGGAATPRNHIALGSVKSNLGHLKAGAGAAGLLKAALSLYHQMLPPTLNAQKPNPNIDFARTPFYLNHDVREWKRANDAPRRCGVSAYGFGGTNFHVVLEEHQPGVLTQRAKSFAMNKPASMNNGQTEPATPLADHAGRSTIPLRGILALGATTPTELREKLNDTLQRAQAGWTPSFALPAAAEIASPERLVIDFGQQTELVDRLQKAQKVFDSNDAATWKALQAQGIFRGRGPQPGKVAFLFPGQGSQYLNMGRELAQVSPIVAEVFAQADGVMTPLLGGPLTAYLFPKADDATLKEAEQALTQTAITQPAVLTLDIALYRLLASYGFRPDLVMGHSLGEYAALIASGVMPFADALEAAAARGAEMTKVSVDDNGWMAAVMAPYAEVEKTLQEIEGYVVAANINSTHQCVIGGASQAVQQAIEVFVQKGYQAVRLPVSHAFHTKIVAPASAPLRQVLDRLHIAPPQLPLVANVTGELYPTTVENIKDLLEQQVASPVLWVKGLETLYQAGVRTFVEVGPKKALKGFVEDVLGGQPEVVALFTNHPKTGELASFNQALCGLYAAGYGGTSAVSTEPASANGSIELENTVQTSAMRINEQMTQADVKEEPMASPTGNASVEALSHLLVKALQHAETQPPGPDHRLRSPAYDRNETPLGSVIISGTGLGLPGAEKPVMAPDNAQRILRGEQFVDLLPERFRKKMLAKRVTRLVKSEDGSGRFETITDPEEVIKLAGRPGAFDLAEEYGVAPKLVEALDMTTQLAMAAGLDALREAGIPLVLTWKKTSTGKYLPERWLLPVSLRDETGVIFASAFPGGDRFADEFTRYYTYQNRLDQLAMLDDLRSYTRDPEALNELHRRQSDLREQLEREPYEFDRRFLFRILSMGHSQFAEYIGARGPNTQVNAACASTAQAIAIAEDWIRSGRCRRVIVIGADVVTGDHLMEWVGAGFLATGAAATDDSVTEAALPFDRRRHGTLLGMGACALVMESEDAVRERGMRGLVELLSSETNNSGFHGTRLDVEHITSVMNNLITAAERRFGLHRHAIAHQTVFMSHETFTPARGGSASAEVAALRYTFGESANDIIVANTKGFTGHPMGVGIEDVIAVKILEYGLVPPVPNFKEADPELGRLNLSRGGRYPVQYAIHLAAGFGSQISLTFTRRIPGALDRVDDKPRYQHWLEETSGYQRAEIEVVKRVLRVKSEAVPERQPVGSTWQAGTGPTVRAAAPGEGAPSFVIDQPARMIVPEPSVHPIPVEVRPMPVAVKLGSESFVAAPTLAPQEPNGHKSEATALPLTSFPTPATDDVTEQVLQIVAEKTGYPRDMLELDLDMEADLGIDTVKQAETFAAIRVAFDIPRSDSLKLRDYPTLKHVIGFVREMRPGPKNSEPADPVSTPPPNSPILPFSTDPVTDKILNIVADKTGYPKEMLEPDLDMEADLGIDTVKQAETFAAIRVAFDIPRRDDLKLRNYPTLKHVVGFVRDMRPDLALGVEAALPKVEASSTTGGPSEMARSKTPRPITPLGTLEDADAYPRRVPTPALRPTLDLCKPTGVRLDEHSRVVVMLDKGGLGQALIHQLHKRGASVFVMENTARENDIAALDEWRAHDPITGVYWLAALDVEPTIEEMDLETWREQNRVRVKNLYTTMRALYDSVNTPGTFLVSATHLGGLHGYGLEGATAPLGGAVTGFVKAYKRECPHVTVKAVDFELARNSLEIAEVLISETLTDPGCVEVGYWNQNRYTITLAEQSARDGKPGLTLDSDTVFLITGAAGGITSAIVTDLAAHSAGTFYLLDLAPLPDPHSDNITLFRTNKDALKQKLIQVAKAAGERPTPVMIDKHLATIEREEAALRAVEAVEAAGGVAHYYSLNLLDGPAMAAVVNEIRQRHGRIDVLIHAGGLEISRALNDKDTAQFNLVFDVKADGFFNLLHAAQGMPIGATVAFSSVAGRFGNSGQTDYSAANDLLCKLTSNLRQWRPTTRGLVIDWTAWGSIGMAARGSIPKIMEMAGIEMLPPEAGVPTLRRELTYGGFRGEVVVAGRLGLMLEEFDQTGGLEPEKVAQQIAERHLLMLGQVKAARLYGGIEIETTLDPKAQPFLHDHALDGTPLLPGVMGTEAFAEVATLLASGYAVAEVAHEHFESPFKFYRHQPRTLHLIASLHPLADGDLIAHTILRSTILPSKIAQPPRPELPAQEKIHFTADVRLTKRDLASPASDHALQRSGEVVEGEAIYRVYFHGPAYQVLERAWVNENSAVGAMAHDLPPNTTPADAASLMAPRLIELCFQTAGIWEIKTKGVMALPLALASVTTYRQSEHVNGSRLYACIEAVNDGESFNAQVVDQAGNVYVQLTGYRTVPMPGAVNLSPISVHYD